MSPEQLLSAAAHAASAVVHARDGKPVDAAREAVEAALDLVPKDVAVQLLTDAAVRRQNAIADAAEALKFGGKP